MSPRDLLLNACKDHMNINISDIKVVYEEYIQYFYSMGSSRYFITISKDRLATGIINEDGNTYASGLFIDVIKYLIDNYSKVNFNEMQA